MLQCVRMDWIHIKNPKQQQKPGHYLKKKKIILTSSMKGTSVKNFPSR